MIRFTVFGIPVPQGSMAALSCPQCGTPGRLIPDNRRTKPWKNTVRKALDAEDPRPVSGPVRVSLAFMMRRPLSHRGTKGHVLPSAPPYPITKPDIDKLTRAILDALTGPVYRDDSQVVELLVLKHYAEDTPRVEIRVEAIDA